MKKIYLLFILITSFASAQEPFITTWEVFNIGSPFEINVAFNESNNYSIDFGDGTILSNQNGPVTHNYTSVGIYTITMLGTFKAVQFGLNSTGDILTVEQWGDNQWTSMHGTFAYCQELTINAPDAPDLSQVTDMSEMFSGCFFNESINHWDVSNVTNMSKMFLEASEFNQPLNNWDVSNVTNMSEMFHNAGSFNKPLDNWNVSNVTDMSSMFVSVYMFNHPIGNWNVSNVTNMYAMFASTISFNQPLSNWDVSNVTNMGYMFSLAESFNQAIDNWDVSNVTNMESMFSGTVNFNQPVESWDVSNVTNMEYMFYDSYFNQPLNNWNISNVTTLNNMFNLAVAFNQPLNSWNISNNTTRQDMFFAAYDFNQDLSNWNFDSNIYLGKFISHSGLDIENYDALLLSFVQQGVENQGIHSVGLHYCDQGVRNHLITELGWTIEGDSLGEECQGNNISGSVIYDENANGCDTEDPLTGSFLVTANNGQFTYSTLSSNGEYDLRVMEDNYTVGLLNVPNYYSFTPITSEINFTGFGNNEELNFCLTANETVSDLNITLLPLDVARPGFESHYRLVAENIGTQTITGTVASLTYNETIQSFVTSSQTPSSTTANQLNFDLGTILPLETKTIDITMQTFTPPTVNGGETINFIATITPDSNDFTPNDNTFSYDQIVVNSFDPNDKTVLQGDEIYMEQTEGYLDYIIRFQNTGSASAITVRIEDLLHENLDWNTFKIVSASHAYHAKITDGNQVEFIFNNINLPHEGANEAGSHGFIAYKIKPVANIQIGDMITGTAGIFFDYNLPIITNSADTEVVEPPLGVSEYTSHKVSLYPNPASSVLHLQAGKEITIENIKIYNLQGSEVLSFEGHQEAINIQDLSSGLYLVSIQTNKGLSKYRLIKK